MHVSVTVTESIVKNFLHTTNPESFLGKIIKHSAKISFLDFTNSSRKQKEGTFPNSFDTKVTIVIAKLDKIYVRKNLQDNLTNENRCKILNKVSANQTT